MKIASLLAVPAFAAALVFGANARAANAFSNDITDLWWNPDESGWGLNLIQQSNVLFATLFVYDANGKAHWYVASNMSGVSAPADQPYIFTGRLYETTGPAFSAASFNASTVTRRDVGSIEFMFSPPSNGHLTYVVDGVTVDKVVTRQTWANHSVSGQYFGGQVTIFQPSSAATCAIKPGTQMFDNITVTQSDASVNITASQGAPPQELCRYSGTYTQAGHMGAIDGAFSCNSGASGSFTLRELEVGVNGFSAAYTATTTGCGVYGNFAAVRAN